MDGEICKKQGNLFVCTTFYKRTHTYIYRIVKKCNQHTLKRSPRRHENLYRRQGMEKGVQILPVRKTPT